MILDKEIKAIKNMAKNYTPVQTMKIYHHFTDLYDEKHVEQVKKIDTEDYLKGRGEVLERYISLYYSQETIARKLIKDF